MDFITDNSRGRAVEADLERCYLIAKVVMCSADNDDMLAWSRSS